VCHIHFVFSLPLLSTLLWTFVTKLPSLAATARPSPAWLLPLPRKPAFSQTFILLLLTETRACRVHQIPTCRTGFWWQSDCQSWFRSVTLHCGSNDTSWGDAGGEGGWSWTKMSSPPLQITSTWYPITFLFSILFQFNALSVDVSRYAFIRDTIWAVAGNVGERKKKKLRHGILEM